VTAIVGANLRRCSSGMARSGPHQPDTRISSIWSPS
jgi:hypothetical protein